MCINGWNNVVRPTATHEEQEYARKYAEHSFKNWLHQMALVQQNAFTAINRTKYDHS